MAEKPNHGADCPKTDRANRVARSERFKNTVREPAKGAREEDAERYLPKNKGRR